MATQMQLRGGTTAENLLFTGAQREVTVDTDRNALVVHDGVTAGGYPTASEAEVVNGTFYFNDNVGGGSAANAYILTPKANTNIPDSYLDGVQFGFVTTNANTGPATANFAGLGVKNMKFEGGIDPGPGDIFGRTNLVYDAAADWLEIQRESTAATPQIRSITGVVLGNALIATMLPATVEFRTNTLTNGAVVARTFVTNKTITAPAGATLGTANTVASRIVILAIDNAGAVELAMTNIENNTLTFDETSLINTVAMSAGATSANIVYSDNARTGVAYRVVGVIDSTQPIAGTWATTPTRVQGQGGQAIFYQPSARITRTAALSTASGTSFDFTGIPTWVKKITVILNLVNVNGSSPISIQIGSGSAEATGYAGCTSGGNSSVNSAAYTTGYLVNSVSASNANYSGNVIISNVSGNIWIASLSIGGSVVANFFAGGGAKQTSGVLDRVRLTTLNGSTAFAGGSVSIIYEG